MTKTKQPSRRHSLIIFLAILTLWMLQTKTIHESWNESTRLAAVQSLVERGTWRIDASPYGHETGDKLLLDGHYYSDKPPLFAAMGTIPYAMMHYGLGATLAVDGCRPSVLCVYYWLTVLMVGIPSALMVTLFYRLVSQQLSSVGWMMGLTALFCFGTVVWPYSLVFNHHLPGAIALFISFYVLFGKHQSCYHIIGAGFLAGVAVMFDLTSVFMAFALFLMVVIYNRKNIFFFIGGGLIPGVITIIFNYQITGGILLPYFSGEGYNYPGSPFDVTVGGQHPPDNIFLHSFRNLVGDHALLGYSPLLIFAIVGLVQVARKKGHYLSIKSALILLGIAGHSIFVLTRTNNFGGDAYGGRFFLPIIPILYFFIVFIVPTRFYQPGGKWVATLWGIAVLVSLFSAYQGVRATWHQVSPPLFVALLSNAPYITVKTNLSLPDNAPIVQDKERSVRNFEMPLITHPLDVKIYDELKLLGYDLPMRRVKPGQALEITMYWQLLRVVQEDYFVFTHLMDANQTQQGGLDRRLQEGYPIAFWYPGEIVTDQRQIPVAFDSTNGPAWLRIGVYQFAGEEIESVPLLVADDELEETSLTVGPFLIGDPPQILNRAGFVPQTLLAVELGEPPIILLRGYDLAQKSDRLQLTLYWESLAQTPTDWTNFVHVRNQAEEIVAQVDRPPLAGAYPTSLWNLGEVIPDEVIIPLPDSLPPGEYSLAVGLYDFASGLRLSIAGSTNNSAELSVFKITTIANSTKN